MREFTCYAPPLFWGHKTVVAQPWGKVTYTLNYTVVGDTLVNARVTYYKGEGGGNKVTEEFQDSIVIETANAYTEVYCEFKGKPLGSTVICSCSP